MGKRVREAAGKVNRVLGIVSSHHTGAYAAQAAYFFVLSMIPIILLLLTMVQFTPATYANVIDAVEQVFPTSVQSFIRSIVTQVYFSQSAKVIPITVRCGSMVSRKRRIVCDGRIELYLWEYRNS